MDNNVPSYHDKKFAARMQQYADPGHPVPLTVPAHGSHNRGEGEENDENIAKMRAFIKIFLDTAE
jgi:prolyl oligopeptidase